MFSLINLQVMFDDTSNKCQWKIKHTSSLEMMPRNSPCDQRNQTKDMLKAHEHVGAIIHRFKKKEAVTSTVIPWASIIGQILGGCLERKSSKDAGSYIIEVAIKIIPVR